MPKVVSKLKWADIFTEDMCAYYQTHIIEFVEDLIFQNDPTLHMSDQQKDFLLSIQNNKRTAAKSGKGVGKTSSFAFAILWFICCFANPKIACTAPSYPQLKSALWPEVALWLDRSLFKDLFEHTSERLYLRESPKNWWAEPRTARDQEAIQGLHAKNMLILVDEGSGVDDVIFEALDSTLTSGKCNKIATAGNPTKITGFFYDCFGKFSHRWTTFTFNAEFSPFVQQDQVEYYLEKYGRGHALFKVNVLGEFPEGNPDSFLTLGDVQAAIDREITGVGEVEIGVDVARYGDDLTVVYARHGYKVYPAKTMAKSSVPEVAELVIKTAVEMRKATGYTKKIKVKVDDTGVGGGVTDILQLDRDHNLEILPCNFGGAGNEDYFNEASVMWGNFKDMLMFMELPDDSKLTEELVARRWELSNSGKIRIEPKSRFKKDFKSSPDRADALMLCFASKIPERVVLKNFDHLDNNIVKDRFSFVGNDRFCSVFYSKGLMASILYTAWDGRRIHVLDEYVGDDSLVYIATHIRQRMPFKKIIGNKNMFGTANEDIYSKLRKFQVRVQENYRFDELGSIEMLTQLMSSGRIRLVSSCTKTIDQLRTWRMEGGKNTQESEYGLCYAMCNLVSELKKEITHVEQDQMFTPFSNEKEDYIKMLKNPVVNNENSWMMV